MKTLRVVLLFISTVGFLFLLHLFLVSYFWIFLVSDHQLLEFSLKRHPWARTEEKLILEVVKTADSIEKGLGDRSTISGDNITLIDGMLFIFPRRQEVNFWMKDMHFDLDICWLRKTDFLACERNVQAKNSDDSNNLSIYQSVKSVDYVLETETARLTEENLKLKLYPDLSSIFSL